MPHHNRSSMSAVNKRFALRIAGLTAFLRLEAGLTRGQEPHDGGPDNEGELRGRVEELESALSAGERRLRNASIPEHWIWTAYVVCDKHRFVFLANHKVATTSILISLLPLFDFEDAERENSDDPKRGPTFTRKGVPVGDVHGLYNACGAQINKAHFLARMGNRYRDYFKFAFVRNPWDRLVPSHKPKPAPRGTGLRRAGGETGPGFTSRSPSGATRGTGSSLATSRSSYKEERDSGWAGTATYPCAGVWLSRISPKPYVVSRTSFQIIISARSTLPSATKDRGGPSSQTSWGASRTSTKSSGGRAE